MPSDVIYQLATTDKTVTAAMEQDPTARILDVAYKVFTEKPQTAKRSKKLRTHEEFSPEDLDRAAQCGHFPYRPSDLFLKIYSNVLDTLEHGPLKNMCSPYLMGSSGVVPMSIISLVPDIMRYYKDLIIDAQHEVFLATNYWEPSWGSHFIHDALIELSKRHVDRPAEERPVVKLIFDRGNPKQVIKNHQLVVPDDWAGLGLPAKEELEGIHFEVMNYHRPIMGTFHAKYMIVDRRIACVSSNNIQDRVNLELNIHLEGPIVDSFYDMALLSWGEKMNPPLPLLVNPGLVDKQSRFRGAREQAEGRENERGGSGDARAPRDCFEEARIRKQDMIERASEALPTHPETPNPETDNTNPIDQQPSPSPSPQPEGEHTHNPAKMEKEKHIEKKKAKERPQPMTDFTLINAEGFEPFVTHAPHDPVPIAMVNRAPHGTPGHQDVDVPQNVAWESGIRLAQKSVFIQTPDFNAPEVVEAILDACRRDVVCTLYVCLGYNDQGEMLPMQGGTNSKVFSKMCETLNKEGQDKRKNLKACWYVAKDREMPVDASKKERNCHVKFCCIDDQLVIAGNGNQDAQSWYHSQEVNVMVDSPQLAAEWVAALNHNQNTAVYGPVGEDGVWRDKDGNIVMSSGGYGGPLNVAKGMMNAVARVQGKGGF